MKLCAVEGCNKEIQVWQTFCEEHFQKYMSQQQKAEENNQKTVNIEMPELPEIPVEPESVKKIKPEKKDKEKKEPELIKISDNAQYLDIRKVAFSGAINVVNVIDWGIETPKELIEKVNKLTDRFYDILVQKR